MYNVAIRRFCDLQRDLPSKSRTHPSPYIIIAMDVLCFCGNFPGKNNSIPTATGSLSCLHIRTEQHNLCNKGTATQKGWTWRASLNSRHEFMSPGAAKISPRVLEECKYIVRDLPLVIFFKNHVQQERDQKMDDMKMSRVLKRGELRKLLTNSCGQRSVKL